MSASILFVAGGGDVQQDVFRNHGMGYWSAAFPALLERRGRLDFDRAEPAVLESAANLLPYDLVIVAWLPPARWKPAYLRSLRAYDGIVLVEGPVPPLLDTYLGVERLPDIRPGDTAVARLSDLAAGYAHPDLPHLGARDFALGPRVVRTKTAQLNRREVAAAGTEDERPRNVAASYALLFRERLEKRGAAYEQPVEAAAAALVWLEFASRLPAGRFRDEAAATNDAFVAALQASDAGISRPAEVAATAAALAAAGADVSTLVERLAGEARPDADTVAWAALAEARLCRRGRWTTAAEQLLDEGLHAGHALALWAYSRTPSARAAGRPLLENVLRPVAEKLRSNPAAIPRSLDGWQLPQLSLLCGALAAVEPGAASALASQLVSELHDEAAGLPANGKAARGRIARGRGTAVSPLVALGLLSLDDEPLLAAWLTDRTEAYGAERLAAWAATPYRIDAYRATDLDEITLEVDGQRMSGLARRGRVMSTSFQLLGYLAWMHSLQPLAEQWLSFERSGNLVNFELALFHLLDVALAEHDRSSLAVSTWPWGARYCATIRHDVDRIPDDKTWRRLRAFESDHGLGVSWFWLADRLDRSKIEECLESGDEVALHAVRVSRKRAELEALHAELPEGAEIVGEALHGAGDGRRGHLSVVAAADAGLAYTDAAAPFYDTPSSWFPALAEDGAIVNEDVLGIRYVSSTDTDPAVYAGGLVSLDSPEVLQALAAAGWYCQILNHPDLNFDRLQKFVEQGLPREGRADLTCAEVARWWTRSHRACELRIDRVADTPTEIVFELVSRRGVEDLALTIQLDATRVGGVAIVRGSNEQPAEWHATTTSVGGIAIRLSLEAATPARIAIRRPRPPRFRELADEIATAAGFLRPDDDYIARRVSGMVEVVTRLTPKIDPSRWGRVVDVGCGYGGFALAMHLTERPAVTVGVDLSPRNVAEGRRLVSSFGIENISFVEADMTELSSVVTDADVMIVANAVYFLPSRRLHRRAMRAFYDALAPGGALVVMTPNRLHYREATTKLVGVQWLPRPVANRYVRARGRRAAYDVRLPSPFELQRWARAAGFRDVGIVDAYRIAATDFRRHFKPRFYLTAVKPS